jgi:protein TonB
MGAVSQKIRTGRVELRGSGGSVYAKPSFWQSLYLLWTFRNFHNLPKQVLNPRQRRLAEKLFQTADVIVKGPIIRFPIIGVIENAFPTSVVKPQPVAAASNVVEMTMRRAEVEEPRALAAGEISALPSSAVHSPVILGTLARYGANLIGLPSAAEEPAEPSKNHDELPGREESDMGTPRSRRALGWMLIAGSGAAALGLFLYFQEARPARAIKPPQVTAEAHEIPAANPASAQPEAVLPSRPMVSKQPIASPAPSAPVQLAGSRQRESQPAASIIHVLPSQPAAPIILEAPPVGNASAASPERVQIAEAPESGFKYPVVASSTLTGKVSLRAVIGTNGAVSEVDILSGNRTLAGAAARAVRHWRYHPYELNGHAVEAETKITVSFLGDDAVSISFSR